MNRSPSVLASWVLAIYRTIESYGVDCDSLLERAGIDKDLLKQHEARVPAEKSNILWKLGVKATGDELLGLRVPDFMTINSLLAVDAAAQASSTLRDILQIACRFSKVATTAVELTVEADSKHCLLKFQNVSDIALCDEASDAFMVVLRSTMKPIIQLLHSSEVFFESIDVTRPKPQDAKRYEETLGCPVNYASAHNQIRINPRLLDIQLPGANPEFSRFSEEMLVSYLSRMKDQGIEMNVRGAIMDLMSNQGLNKAAVADRLHTSVRHLTRKLSEVDLTFSQLVETIRQEKAISLIKQPHISLGDIAFLLGFVDSNSFTRAFRRWTGVTPGHYRSKL